ncbi:MAG: DUF928 domain-containing protein [Spirulina sp. SIO3F2]|nr:DUF928 domain-containing protein [Spirulina sp. SIO3F2]
MQDFTQPYSIQARKGVRRLALWGTTALLAALTSIPLTTIPSIAQGLPSLADWQEAGFTPNVSTSAERSSGGGTRSVVTEIQIAALIPGHNSYGVTVKPDPNLLVYLAAGSGQRLVFLEVEEISRNADDSLQYTVIHEQELEIERRAGLMKFQLPATRSAGTPLLNPGQDYRWVVTVYSDVSGDSIAGEVTGYISHIPSENVNWTNPETISQLNNLSSHEQGQYLFQNYIWYDGLVALAQGYQVDPAGLLADWEQVLATSGLEGTEAEQVLVDMAANPNFIEAKLLHSQ